MIKNNYNKKSLSGFGLYHSSHMRKALFLLLILIEVAFFSYLIFERRIIAGHDGFHYLNMQYCFMSNVSYTDAIHQWSPFIMHGTIVIFVYLLIGGLLPNILFLFGDLLNAVNFLPIFYAGFFVDELVLLIGVWLLGKRIYESPFTQFFVCSSIMGSCIWFLQPWYNFHLYYAIPLILYFIHMFLDMGQWRYLFGAGNLLFMQCFGNLPHFAPIITFVIFLYFIFYLFFNIKEVSQKLKELRFGLPFCLTIISIIVSFGILYLFVKFGTIQLTSFGLRNADGTVDLSQFLIYGGVFTWRRWLEFVLGVSPCVDYTLYIGVMGLPFILIGIAYNTNKRNIHFILTAILLVLFSMGTIVSLLGYYCWPMMKFYRHLFSISPVIKVFLCFVAGFGFDAVLSNKLRFSSSFFKKSALVFTPIFMLGLSFAIFRISENHEMLSGLTSFMVPENAPPIFLPMLNTDILSLLLTRTAFLTFIGSCLFLLILLTKSSKVFYLLVIVLLILHATDIYSFKFSELKLKTAPLNKRLYALMEFQSMPYAKRRDLGFWTNNSPRAELLKCLPALVDWGSYYSSLHAFLFKDQLGNPFKTDFWMLPLDKYMKAYWGQDINDASIEPKGLFHRTKDEFPRLEFPKNHPAALKISGVTEDKIQFFSQVQFLSSEDEIAANITDPDYKGDILFLSSLTPAVKIKNPYRENTERHPADLSSSYRLYLNYKILQFDANNLVVTTHVDDMSSAWLFYSDVWHPYWKATVNGKEVPVYKANLAYKAVPLEKGFNKVHFHFKWRFLPVFEHLLGFNSLFWLLIIAFLAGKIIFSGFPADVRDKMNPQPVS